MLNNKISLSHFKIGLARPDTGRRPQCGLRWIRFSTAELFLICLGVLIGSHAIVIEYLAGIVIGNTVIFQIAGMISKGYAVSVQRLGQLSVRFYLFAPPQGQRLFISRFQFMI